jgi:hypothetical protein
MARSMTWRGGASGCGIGQGMTDLVRQRERDASLCIKRHQNFALAPVDMIRHGPPHLRLWLLEI